MERAESFSTLLVEKDVEGNEEHTVHIFVPDKSINLARSLQPIVDETHKVPNQYS